MKTRKMWANRRYFESNGGFVAFTDARSAEAAPVPLLVTSLEDAPDFEPGDRVRWVQDGVHNGEVMGHPFHWQNTWLVPVCPDNRMTRGFVVIYADCLAKLPREKTTLLRVRTQEVLTPDLLVKHLRSRTGVLDVRVEEASDER